MKEQTRAALSRFEAMIAPFTGGWRSIRYFAMAGNLHGQWIVVAGRFVLSEEAPATERLFLQPTADSVICSGDIPFDRFATILPAVVLEGSIPNALVNPLNASGTYDMEMAWDERDWAEPRVYGAVAAKTYDLQTPCIIFEREAGRLVEIFRRGLLGEVNAKVPLHTSAYKDLSDLFDSQMPGFRLELSMQSSQALQFLAVLPFQMQYWNDDQFLTVKAPAALLSGQTKVVIHVGNENVTRVPADLQPVDGHISIWRIPVPWPQGSRQGTAKLYFNEENIDELEFPRWKDALNLRVVGDDGFRSATARSSSACPTPGTTRSAGSRSSTTS